MLKSRAVRTTAEVRPGLRQRRRLHKLGGMGIAEWMRVIDTVGGLAQMTGKLRPRANPEAGLAPAGEPAGGLEARLAGVVVAALKEAFDRDRARMDLERAQLEAERKTGRRGARGGASAAGRGAGARSAPDHRHHGHHRVDALRGAGRVAARHAWSRAAFAARRRLALRVRCARLCVCRGAGDLRVGCRDSGAARRSRNGGTVAAARRAGRDCRESAGCALAMPREAPSIPSTGPTTSTSEDS